MCIQFYGVKKLQLSDSRLNEYGSVTYYPGAIVEKINLQILKNDLQKVADFIDSLGNHASIHKIYAIIDDLEKFGMDVAAFAQIIEKIEEKADE